MSDMDLGFGGQRVPVPGHIGLFYSGAEDRSEQFDFLRIALGRPSEAIVVFGPQGAPATFLTAFESNIGRELRTERAAGTIESFEGDRDPDAQLATIVRTIGKLAERGAVAVRVLAISAWDSPRWPAPEDFLWLESRLDTACASLPAVIVCAYDLTSLPGPALIHGGIESHTLVSIGGRVAANQLAVEPESYLSDRLLRLPWLRRDPPSIETESARGAHACAFFMSRDEEYATLLPLIQEAVARGDALIHIIDPERRADHLQRLSRGGLDVEGLASRQRLDVRDWQEMYLMQGRFDPARTLAVLGEMSAARPGGVHLVADMAWALGRAPGVDALVEYEARFNEVLPRYNHTVICTYDSARFAAATMLDLLRAHPVVILGGAPQENGLYAAPSALIDEVRARTAVAPR